MRSIKQTHDGALLTGFYDFGIPVSMEFLKYADVPSSIAEELKTA